MESVLEARGVTENNGNLLSVLQTSKGMHNSIE